MIRRFAIELRQFLSAIRLATPFLYVQKGARAGKNAKRRIEHDVKLRKMPRVVRGMILRKHTTGSSWEDFTSKSQRITRGELLR